MRTPLVPELQELWNPCGQVMMIMIIFNESEKHMATDMLMFECFVAQCSSQWISPALHRFYFH